MNVIINNEQTNFKTLEYSESFLAFRKKILYNNIELKKVNKNLFEYNNNGVTESFEVHGNQIFGVTIKMFGNKLEVIRKITWYEIVLTILIFISSIIFSGIVGCKAVTMDLLGGTIASFVTICIVIGVLLTILNLILLYRVNKWYLQIIVAFLLIAITILLSYIFAVFVFKIVL